MTIADDLVAAHAPWLTDDLETYLRAVGGMFTEIELYSADSEEFDGWTILLDVDRCPVKALPYLAQYVGERLPVGLSEDAQRQWIRDAPNQRRGTIQSIVRAAARQLESEHPLVTVIERDGGADKLTVVTYDFQTGVRQNLVTNPKAGAGVTTGWVNVGLLTFDTANFPGTGGLPPGVLTAFRCIADADNDRAYYEFQAQQGRYYYILGHMQLGQLGGGSSLGCRMTLNASDDGAVLGQSAEDIVDEVGSEFRRQTIIYHHTSATELVRIRMRASGSPAAGNTTRYHFTAVMVEESFEPFDPSEERTYFDGDMQNAVWLGASNASISRRSNESAVLRELETVVPGDITLNYSSSPGQTWSQVAVDNADWDEVQANYATWSDLAAATPEGTYTR